MKSFKKEKTKPLKKYSILATAAEIMYICFHKNFKQTNETNHTYYRWSTFGQKYLCGKLALSLSPTPVYLATARIWDEEFRKRVIHHQERRGPEWTNIEEEKELSRHQVKDNVVLIDCVTLWCTNFFLRPAFRYRPGALARSKRQSSTASRHKTQPHLCNQ